MLSIAISYNVKFAGAKYFEPVGDKNIKNGFTKNLS
jgi:hypothetical protein